MSSYVLDIETLLILVARLKRSGTLTADVQFPRLGRCIAQITINQGVLTICTLTDMNGQVVVQGEQALSFLAHKQIEWSWKHIPAPVTMSVVDPEKIRQPSASAQSAIPRLQSHVTQQFLQNFPRNERRILLLIDGLHTISEIAQLLALPEQIVRENILRFRNKDLLHLDE